MPAAFRRSHRKSREGCELCKQRRVKCDEGRPQCQTCRRRRAVCKYPDGPQELPRTSIDHHVLPASSITPRTQIPNATALETTAVCSKNDDTGLPYSFDYFDLRLLTHFHAHVCATLDEEDDQPLNWRDQITSSSFEHPVVVHALLAFSALHLARIDEQSREQCGDKAIAHHTEALRYMIPTLAQLDGSNAGPLFLGSVLMCLYNFASGPQAGQYLVFSSEIDAEWIYLLKGVRSIILNAPEIIGQLIKSPDNDHTATVPVHATCITACMSLTKLQEIEEIKVTKVYAATTDRLKQAFIESFTDQHPDSESIASHHAFKWLYFLESEYLARLQSRQPLALVMFAHFVVLLHYLRHLWYLEGWSHHIMEVGLDIQVNTRTSDTEPRYYSVLNQARYPTNHVCGQRHGRNDLRGYRKAYKANDERLRNTGTSTMYRTTLCLLFLITAIQASPWQRGKHHSWFEDKTWPPAPAPEQIDIIQLPLPPVAPSNTTGACSTEINPHKTGCIGQTTGLQAGNFYPDGDHVLAHVAFTGAPADPDPASIYVGQQVILIKADGSVFSNGDAWKCITCGVPASRNALLAKGSGDYSYPQAFHDGKRILAGTFIISCGDHKLVDDECTPDATSVYQIRLDNQADLSGPGAWIRELRLHPDNVHIGLNSFGVTAGGALTQHAYWGRLDFNAAPTTGTPISPRYDLANVSLLVDSTSSTGAVYTSGDQIFVNNSAITIGELRGFSGTGDEITYIGNPVEACNIDVFAVNIHNGHVRRLTTHPGYVDPVEFSPNDGSFVILDTRGTGRTEFMDGIRWLPPIADQITAIACSSVRNNGNRRFFQPWLLDRYGDRDGYYGQSLNNAHLGEYGSGEIDDPQWNGQADAWFSPDDTRIVYWQAQAVSPACGGSNPLPCYESKEEGGRDGRVMLATLSSRTPLPPRRPIEPFADVIPWATMYKPGDVAPERSYTKQGHYKLQGTVGGYAQVEIVENSAKNAIKTVVVELFDYADHAGGIINGYQNISVTTEAVVITKLDWYANVTRTGTDAGCQHTSEDGFHMSIDALTNIFEANGTLTTTVNGVEYVQPRDDT